MIAEEPARRGIEILLDYGALGILILILLGALVLLWKHLQRMQAEHRSDRKEWLEENQRREDRTLQAYNRSTEVITELKTIIVNRKV